MAATQTRRGMKILSASLLVRSVYLDVEIRDCRFRKL